MQSHTPKRTNKQSLIMVIFAIAAVLLGIFFRFKGLGYSPFAIDEYYLATSVKNIVDHGIPRFDVGGYYTRGLLLQYLVAPLFAFGIEHEIAFRVVTVLFNIAAIPAVFLLARNLSGVPAACVAVSFYCLSVWEVEFARFARMYAPFGAIFLWYLYFLYKRLVTGDQTSTKWMLLLTLLSIFVSEFAVFPALMNLLPLVFRPSKKVGFDVVVPVFLIGAVYYWRSIPFRWLGAPESLPPDFPVAESSGPSLPISLPVPLIEALPSDTLWLLLFAIPAIATVAASIFYYRQSSSAGTEISDKFWTLAPIVALGLGLFGMFGLAIVFVLVHLLLSRYRDSRFGKQDVLRTVAPSSCTLLVSFLFWLGYAGSTSWWQEYLPQPTNDNFKNVLLLLFNFPNVFRDVVVPWRDAMPVQTGLMALLVFSGVLFAASEDSDRKRSYLLITAIVLGLIALVSLLNKPYFTTRYTYFVYPVVLILCSVTLVEACRLATGRHHLFAVCVVFSALLFAYLSEDFDYEHLRSIDSDAVTYRIGFPRAQVDQYYPRRDFRSPAEYVNANRMSEDIVISTEYAVPYYLDRLDYMFMDRNGERYRIVAAHEGTRDIWEGVFLLGTAKEIFDLIESSNSTVWLLSKSVEYQSLTPAELEIDRLLSRYRVYSGVDKHIDVYRLPPGSPVMTGSTGCTTFHADCQAVRAAH